MFYRARKAMNRAWFDFQLRQALSTPPLPPANSETMVASMLCHGDLVMYMLALKSLVRRLDFSPRVCLLNDGSLTPDDIALLQRHVPSLTLRSIDTIDRGSCPKGGAWELLLMIADLVQEGYVIQLDSDTLTMGPVPEVNSCAASNRNFALLGDKSFPHVEPMLEACARTKGSTHPHVQAHVERNFDKLTEARDLKYLRGNAGFVGLATRSFDRDRVQWFSDLMRQIADDKWNQWGSEQVTMNLLIANSENPLPLPSPKYVSYWNHPEIDYTQSSFLHFIGPYRYAHGLYAGSAKKVLRELNAK